MRTETYHAKNGKTRYRPVLSESEAQAMMFDAEDMGFCVACGQEAYGVEPDARRYRCESCDSDTVYGLEQLILMGIAKIA
jgi:hypothetical protein